MPNEHIDAVREHVNRFVWGTIQLQLTTGMRPGEERLMHLRDIEMSGEVWEYRPQEHKTKHHGRQRLIFIGPKGQQIVKQFLVADRETASKDRRRINCRLSGVEHVFNVLGTMESCPTYFCLSPKVSAIYGVWHLPRWKRIWLPGTLLTQTKLPPRQARWRAANWNRRRDLVARRGFHPRRVDGVPGNTV